MDITYTPKYTKADIIELAQHTISKFYEEGYITSSEDTALFEELNNTTCDASGYIQMRINTESRKLEFVCFDESVYFSRNSNICISAYITVLTPQDEADFSVSYSSENDKFYVNEPHLN